MSSHTVDVVTDPWSSYQRDARTAAGEVEQKIMTLQRMSEAGGGSKDEALAIEADVRNVLQHLDTLNRAVAEEQLTHAERLQVQRYRDVHDDSRYEIKRLMQTLVTQRQRNELLGNIHDSIQEYTDSRRLLDAEADSIDHATRSIEALHAQATQGHDNLQRTQQVLARAQQRAVDIVSSVPVINNILKKIDNKHHRDRIVLGSLIAVLLFVCWVFF